MPADDAADYKVIGVYVARYVDPAGFSQNVKFPVIPAVMLPGFNDSEVIAAPAESRRTGPSRSILGVVPTRPHTRSPLHPSTKLSTRFHEPEQPETRSPKADVVTFM